MRPPPHLGARVRSVLRTAQLLHTFPKQVFQVGTPPERQGDRPWDESDELLERHQMEPPFPFDADGLGSILEAIPEVVVVIDSAGVIHYVNRLEEGFTRDQVIGVPARDFLDPAARVAFDLALKAVWAEGDTEEVESGVTIPSGAQAWYQSRMAPIQRGGRTVAVLVMARNVKELSSAQTEIFRLRRLLPLCAWCGRTRTRDGRWVSLDDYVQEESGSEISHGICADCTHRQLEDPDRVD